MIAADDIRRGDVVRLRNGDEVEVDSVTTMYHDRDGDHEGPFVTERKTFHHYLLSDVAEIARRNERLCVFCGEGVTSTNPDVDFCRRCHDSGQAQMAERAEQLGALTTMLDGPTVAIDHTGGGCFWVSIRFADQDDYYVITDGDSGLPTDEEGKPVEGGWGYIGLHSDDEASPHYEGTVLRWIDDGPRLSDEEVARDILRHRKGQRPYPRRGECRILANQGRGKTWEQSTGYKLTVPAALAREIGKDVLFRLEVTDEGLLYRYVEGSPTVRGERPPDWIKP